MSTTLAYDCSYAGIPFRLPTKAIQDHVDRFRLLEDLQDLYYTADPGRSLQALNLPRLPVPSKPRIGDFWYPTGMSRCGVFHGLATGDDVRQMVDAALPTTGTSAGGSVANTFRMKADGLGDSQFIETPMYLLPPRPLSIVDEDTLQAIYLVTLVDNRYKIRFLGNTNLVSCSALTSSATWATLLTRVAISPYTLTVAASISADYGQPEPDSALYQTNEGKPAILDAIAANVGGFIVRDFDENFRLIKWSTGLTNTLAARLAYPRAGGAVFNPDTSISDRFRRLNLPHSVTVTFPSWVTGADYYQPEAYRDHYKTGWAYGSVYSKALLATSLGTPYSTQAETLANTWTKVLRTTAKATYANDTDAAASGAPTNATAVNALATQLAKDHYDAELSALDEVYEGVQDWPTDTGHDILWTWNADIACTRVTRLPFNSAPSEFQHGFGPLAPAAGGGGTTITVKDDKGNTFSGIDTLQLDYATVSNPSGSTAESLPDNTAYNARGIIDTVQQWLGAGNKGADDFYSRSFRVVPTAGSFSNAPGAIVAINAAGSTASLGVDVATSNNEHFRVILRGTDSPAGFYGELDGNTYASAFAVSTGAGMVYGVGTGTTFTTVDGKTITVNGGIITNIV